MTDIDLAHDAIIVADAERRIVSWNGGATEIYGWTEAEVFAVPAARRARYLALVEEAP